MKASRATSRFYTLDQMVAQNNLCESWIATDTVNHSPCFIKMPNSESSLPESTILTMMTDSLTLQRSILSNKVVTAVRKRTSNGRLFIEYPYLSSDRWHVLTPKALADNIDKLLVEICAVVDYLHQLKLVHCDLKLENFMFRTTGKDVDVRLVDLDFLSRDGSRPDARLFGTPEYIAPEIKTNAGISTRSDNYSMGIAFAKFVDHLGAAGESREFAAVIDKLESLSKRLTIEDSVYRPPVLVDALCEAGQIDEATRDKARKQVLAMFLLNGFRENRRRARRRKVTLVDLAEQVNLAGLSKELLGSLDAALVHNPRRTFKLLRHVVRGGAIDRYADYWHLSLDDKSLLHTYRAIDNIVDDGEAEECTTSAIPLDRLIEQATSAKQADLNEKALLLYKEAMETIETDGEQVPLHTRTIVYNDAARLAKRLHRLIESTSYYEKALELDETPSLSRLELLENIARGYGNSGFLKKALRAAESGAELSRQMNQLRFELIFESNRAWEMAALGHYAESAPIYDAGLARAEQLGLVDIQVRYLYSRAVTFYRRGEQNDAIAVLEQAQLIAEKNNCCANEYVRILVVLADLYTSTAQYARSVRSGKKAIAAAETPEQTQALTAVYPAMLGAYMRLGDFKNAEFCVQRLRHLRSLERGRRPIVQYLLHKGYYENTSGDYRAARKTLFQGLEFRNPDIPETNIGKLYQNLAEVAVYNGDIAEYDRHVADAREIFSAMHQTAALTEIDLIATIGDLYYRNIDVSNRLIRILEELSQQNSRYYVLLCLFHVLMNQPNDVVETAIEIASPAVEYMAKSKAPFVDVINLILPAVRQSKVSTDERIRSLKSAFTILKQIRLHFLALIVCRRIGELYQQSGNAKLAQKFFAHGVRVAERLDNEHMRTELSALADRALSRDKSSSELITSVLEISKIIKDITDYDRALQRLVRFAVDLTGAERGAILLHKESSGKLQVSALVNCDEGSLEDIRHISSSIPKQVSAKLSPLIIDNALTDNRTSQMKSIIDHNILSVICFPIMHDGRLIGVIYLDHHTIPALFDMQDVSFIQSIANFIAVVMSAAREVRSISQINEQLVRDLTQSGQEFEFITNDPNMIELQRGLPDISRSNTPVLLTGESGTGKGIIAWIIHKLSSRSDGPWAKLNCAAIPENMVEAELFGVVKGYATDVQPRAGRLRDADTGTMFLDEIGDVPMSIQNKLVTVLEDQAFVPLGTSRTVYTDIRFIYATNKNLQQLVAEGKFRQDLFYRINRIAIEIPPLRERPGDIMLLLEHFIRRFSSGRPAPKFSTEVLEMFHDYLWPGNVRELKNLVERLCVLYPGQRITRRHLPPEFLGKPVASAGDDTPSIVAERIRVQDMLVKHGWNITRTAAALGIARNTLKSKIRKFGITRSA